MRILLTIHQFFPQYTMGTEVLTLSVAKELLKRGHEVHVYTGNPVEQNLTENERFDEYEFEGIHVYRFHHSYTPMGGQDSMLELSYDNRLAAKFFENILQNFKPEVVHFFHLNRLGSGLIDLAVQARIPAFLTPTDFWAVCHTAQLVLCNGVMCHGPSAHAGNCVKHITKNTQKGLVGSIATWLPTKLVDFFVLLTQKDVLPHFPFMHEVLAIDRRLSVNISRLNRLNRILSPNRFMTQMLTRHGVLPHLVNQSAFGVDISENKLSVTGSAPPRPFRIGFVGTLAQHKGCHVLIEAFKSLQPGGAVLKIYGRTTDFPDYFALLRKMAEGRFDIEFCGEFPNSEIAEVLAGLDVLVVPSLWYENTPLVVYSAQAAKCPVVASDYPSICEVIENEKNGLLFQPGSSSALSKQLFRLLHDPELVQSLVANSQTPKSTSAYVDELLSLWAVG